MSDSTAHIVAMPQYVLIVRIVQLVLAILIMALVGFSLDTSSVAWTYFDQGPLAFVVFDCVWTLLVLGYLVGTPLWFPIAYNMWGHLVLEIVTTIFWLGGWASLAAWSSANSIYFEHVKGKTYSKWATTAAGAAFGAVMWVLWIVTFVTFAMRLHRHRHDPQNQHLSQFGFPEKGQNHEMNRVQGVQSTPQQYPQPTQTPVYPESTPTPVQYVQGPPPPQWQQSPPPQQYGQ